MQIVKKRDFVQNERTQYSNGITCYQKKKDEEKRREEEHQNTVSQMISVLKGTQTSCPESRN